MRRVNRAITAGVILALLVALAVPASAGMLASTSPVAADDCVPFVTCTTTTTKPPTTTATTAPATSATTATTAPPTTEPGSTTTAPDGSTTLTIPGETTTTAAGDPGSTTTTAVPGVPPPDGDPNQPPPTLPPGVSGSPEEGGEGGEDGALRTVPPDAQRIINAVKRTAPSDNHVLVENVQKLIASGVDPDEAARIAYGRFPVAGYAHWSDDWLYPRWTGSVFRFHLGCDVMAAYGTPVRAPVDGIAKISTSELGGLSVKVVQPDGTFYYLAHLSGTAPGLVNGQSVATGDIVGFVGTSGNAAGGPAHLHIAIHPRGGDPIPPKPVLDQFVRDAAAAFSVPTVTAAPTSRRLLGTALVRLLSNGISVPGGTDLLWATAANPAGGGLRLAQLQLLAAASSIDWATRAAAQQAYNAQYAQGQMAAWTVLGPLTPSVLAPHLGP